MRLRARLLLLLGVLAAAPAAAEEARPRVLSLDYCADQYVLALADRDQIAAITSGPEDAFSALRARAQGLARVREASEDVIALQPDLIIRSHGGGPRALDFYNRLGLQTLQLDFAPGFDGVRARLREVGAALHQTARAEDLIAQMDARLDEAGRDPSGLGALYVTPGGVTAGAGVIIDDVFKAAGVRNIVAERGRIGWPGLSLEALMLETPDLIVTGFFDMPGERVNAWSVTRHRLMRERLATRPSVAVDGALLACSAWFVADAALTISDAAKAAGPER